MSGITLHLGLSSFWIRASFRHKLCSGYARIQKIEKLTSWIRLIISTDLLKYDFYSRLPEIPALNSCGFNLIHLYCIVHAGTCISTAPVLICISFLPYSSIHPEQFSTGKVFRAWWGNEHMLPNTYLPYQPYLNRISFHLNSTRLLHTLHAFPFILLRKYQ